MSDVILSLHSLVSSRSVKLGYGEDPGYKDLGLRLVTLCS